MQNLIKKQDAKGSDFIASLYSRGVKPINSNIQPSGDSLYAMIWKPMLPYLKSVKTIYYAPAGMLHQIAFSAIANSKDSLISDIYDLRCVASTSVLIKDKTKEEKPKTISLFGGIAYDADTTQIKNLAIKYQNKDDLAMARSYSLDSTRGGNWNYLPGTLREVQDIKTLSENQNITTTFYSAENATEESFKSMSGKVSPDVIHIATHGFFFPNIEKKEKRMGEESVYRMNEDPLFRSGLLFSGANYAWKGKPITGIEDGILTAYEVGNLNLKNTKLVVLSACETGLGDIKGSEGVYGLQRAFKMAGVKYIIMSLWQVPDKETSVFMKLFYTNWFKNGDIRKSFTETQREMRKKYTTYYWAAFVLVE
jgi:CHAT domain-containing protein